MTEAVVINPLSTVERMELEHYEDCITASFRVVAQSLNEIQSRELYRAYGTWTDYLKQRWGKSDSWFRQQRIAYTIAEKIESVSSLTVENVNQGVAINSALKGLPEPVQTEVIREASTYIQATGEKLSKSIIESAREVIEKKNATGHVDIGDGSSTPVQAALSQEHYEKMERQRQHIRENSRFEFVSKLEVTYSIDLLREFVEWVNGCNVQKDESIRLILMKEKPA